MEGIAIQIAPHYTVCFDSQICLSKDLKLTVGISRVVSVVMNIVTADNFKAPMECAIVTTI